MRKGEFRSAQRRPSKRKKRFIDRCIDEGNFDLIVYLQKYYEDRDLDDRTSLLSIFNALYDSKEKLSIKEIGTKCFIEEGALRNFILKANAFAEKKAKVKKNEGD